MRNPMEDKPTVSRSERRVLDRSPTNPPAAPVPKQLRKTIRLRHFLLFAIFLFVSVTWTFISFSLGVEWEAKDAAARGPSKDGVTPDVDPPRAPLPATSSDANSARVRYTIHFSNKCAHLGIEELDVPLDDHPFPSLRCIEMHASWVETCVDTVTADYNGPGAISDVAKDGSWTVTDIDNSLFTLRPEQLRLFHSCYELSHDRDRKNKRWRVVIRKENYRKKLMNFIKNIRLKQTMHEKRQ